MVNILFGGANEVNECLTFDAKYHDEGDAFVYDDQYSPHRIDIIIKDKCCTQKIVDISFR